MKRLALASVLLAGCGLYFGDNQTGGGNGGSGAPLLVAGSRSTCARRAGAWWCWGANYADQLTDMPGWDPRPKFSPQQIAPTGAILAMGGAHSCSVDSSGTVQCWGSNWSGQLGRVTDPPSVNAEQNLPAAVQGLPAKALSVATGGKHTCAVLTDHTLWCWGDNTHGQLGVAVASGPTPRHALDHVASVALGDAHSCAVLLDHSVACWGAGTRGELGDGSLADRSTPATVPNVTAVSLALGGAHTCALDASGAVTCWGANDRGQLGDGTTTDRPSSSAPVVAAAVELVAGGDHTCVRRSDGSAACWGDNDDGELGDGTLAQRNAPAAVAMNGSLIAIATGIAHTCAMRADHSLACWGRSTTGELGDGTHVTPSPQSTALPAGASALAVGATHACVIAGSDHRVYCWGDDHHGQLGDGAPQLASATPVDTGLTNVSMLAAGVGHTCAVQADQSLWCWGDNADGELGDGTHQASATPVKTSISAIAVAAGDGFTCVITPSAALQCFGRNDHGQLATGATLPALASISAGRTHACAITTGGAALCWGDNSRGQIGNGGVGASSTPAGPAGTYLQISAGGEHTCAIPSPPTHAVCWGANDVDQLGTFTLDDQYAPSDASVGLGVGTLVVGSGLAHTCVSGSDDSNGNGWTECFGLDIDGETAVGFSHLTPPMGLAMNSYATAVGGGDGFTCALVGSSVQCWGDNSRGQLGTGTFSRSTMPLDIVLPSS